MNAYTVLINYKNRVNASVLSPYNYIFYDASTFIIHSLVQSKSKERTKKSSKNQAKTRQTINRRNDK
jgi:hypothetical protein